MGMHKQDHRRLLVVDVSWVSLRALDQEQPGRSGEAGLGDAHL